MAYSPEVQAIFDRVMNPDAPVAPKPAKVKKPKPATAWMHKPPVPKPKYDRAKILAMHKAKMPVTEIAATLGAHRATVSRVLTALGVDPAERKGGPVRREKCQRGHSMADAYEQKGGGRGCRSCKRERERV